MKHVITCNPSGSIEAVQNDEVPLHQLGDSEMVRASDVTWDVGDQMWKAEIREEFRNKNKTVHTFWNESRAVCIDWEIEYLNDR